MKTKDFETAIAALNVGIVIDEMKLRHSDVRQVIAHQGSKGIVWDERVSRKTQLHPSPLMHIIS